MKDEIKEIREYIACPQFGDNHYGEWGALRLDQRIKIKQLLDYITILEQENEDLQYFQKIIDKIIIIKDYPYKEDSDYILCNMSKQELYKSLCDSRKRIYKGEE